MFSFNTSALGSLATRLGRPAAADGDGCGDRIIEVKDLRKVYPRAGGKEVVAVDGVSFNVNRGEVVGLLGSNGAGKTTTLKSLCTLIRPTSGSIRVGGVDALKHPKPVLRTISAVLEGTRNIYWRLTVRENLEFFAGLHGISRRTARPHIDRLLAIFHLEAKASVPASMLSRGMLQKLGIACALVKGTEIVLLDEPTLGLDVETTYELRTCLKALAAEEGRTLLLSSHDMNVVQDVCERVIIIHKGRVVVDDRMENVLQLFGGETYQVTLDAVLDENQNARLQELFPRVRIASGTHQSSLEVDLSGGRRLYDLIDVLRDNGAGIRSMERRVPNLEEAYLSIVSGS